MMQHLYLLPLWCGLVAADPTYLVAAKTNTELHGAKQSTVVLEGIYSQEKDNTLEDNLYKTNKVFLDSIVVTRGPSWGEGCKDEAEVMFSLEEHKLLSHKHFWKQTATIKENMTIPLSINVQYLGHYPLAFHSLSEDANCYMTLSVDHIVRLIPTTENPVTHTFIDKRKTYITMAHVSTIYSIIESNIEIWLKDEGDMNGKSGEIIFGQVMCTNDGDDLVFKVLNFNVGAVHIFSPNGTINIMSSTPRTEEVKIPGGNPVEFDVRCVSGSYVNFALVNASTTTLHWGKADVGAQRAPVGVIIGVVLTILLLIAAGVYGVCIAKNNSFAFTRLKIFLSGRSNNATQLDIASEEDESEYVFDMVDQDPPAEEA